MRIRRVVLLAGAAMVLGAGCWVLGSVRLPTAAAPALTLQDRNGLPLRTTRAGDGSRSTWLALDEMDPQLIQAFVALEDRRFYGHHGVDLRAVGRAIVDDVRHRRIVSGASTITMQLARLLHPDGHGIGGKLSQTLWALRLEAHLTKQQILEQYLNRVPLGQGAVGVPAAAALYFDASATHLSLGQAALLAGLASAPSPNNPYASAPRARARRATALDRMVALGFADRDAATRAAAEPLTGASGQASFLAPHFTSAVLSWAAGATHDARRTTPDARRTSLDLALQTELEGEVGHTVSLLHDEEVREAAAVVLDNATGEILAWVGSPDFWADSAGQVDMVVSPRQPGSALKPFLYALAFERGTSAASVLPDLPHTYRISTGPYQPQNYDRRFHGPVRAREALASSFNMPAVDLTDRLGAGSLLRILHQAGFASLAGSADQYGLGLSLGNGSVTLLEMANGYRGLANGGVWRPVRWEGGRTDGRTDGQTDGRRFVSRGAALLVLDVLSDPVARVPGFGVDTPFDFPFPVAVKTGTSHHFTDNWAVGVTAGFTVAVWVGNFSGRPMRRISGITGAGPLLHRAVMAVSRRYAPGALPSPAEAGAAQVRICRLSGLRAGTDCPGTDEWFLPGTAPTGHCDWHQHGGSVRWPAAYAAWAAKDGRTDGQADRRTDGQRAPERLTIRPPDRLTITSPQDGDRYQIPPGVDRRYATIALSATGAANDEPVRWSVDGEAISGARWALQTGSHRIRATASTGRRAEIQIHVR